MTSLEEIASKANMIVNGYAFTKAELGIRVLNLNKPNKATLLSEKGEVLETTNIKNSFLHQILMKKEF